jgi:hypothetical protein
MEKVHTRFGNDMVVGIGVGIGIRIEWPFGVDDALRSDFLSMPIPIAIPTPMTPKDSGFSVVRNADRFFQAQSGKK